MIVPHTPTRQGYPVENAAGERYWNKFRREYPFQTAVPYMSFKDIDPKLVARLVTKEFIRVPFKDETHFGFKTAGHLLVFENLARTADERRSAMQSPAEQPSAKPMADDTPVYPKDGSWFSTESIDRVVYRYAKYKPDGARQMGKPGRWQSAKWNASGFFKWENCDEPQGVLCDSLESEGPISKLLRESKDPKATVRLWSEQSNEPVHTHGGLASATYWYLAVEGVTIMRDSGRHRWCPDREKYTRIEHAPSNMREIFEKLSAAFGRGVLPGLDPDEIK